MVQKYLGFNSQWSNSAIRGVSDTDVSTDVSTICHNETDYSCKQLLKDSYLTFNDLEGQHTLISLWFTWM